MTSYARQLPEVADLDQDDLDAARGQLEANYEAAIRSAPSRGHRLNAEYDQALVLGNWRGLDSLTAAVLHQEDSCAGPDWIHLTAVPFGRARSALDYFERLMACDPLGSDYRRHWGLAAIWAGEADRLIAIAGRRDESGQRQSIDAYVRGLIAAGRTDEAEAVIDTEVRNPGHATLLQYLVALRKGDSPLASEIGAFGEDVVDDTLLMAARRGDRDAANAAAALIDSRPYGYISLLQITYFCTCGAPFDLEATPTLAGMLETSGLTWPPPDTTDWPLKDW